MPLIVLPYKKSHIPGYRSIEKELGWFFLLHTNFLGVLGLCVYKCALREEGHSGFMSCLALFIVGIPEGFSS